MESSSLSFKVAPLSTHELGPHPTLIFLHGRGTDENDLLGLTPYLDPHLLVASVRAPYRFPYGGYTWFDLDDSGEIAIDQLIMSRDIFLRWFDDFQKNYPVDSNRVFLFGFSMGAMMSLAVSLLSPRRFKGIVAHSGFLPEHTSLSYQWDTLGDLSFYIAHGKKDPIVPVDLARRTHQQLLKASANVLYREYLLGHSISDESLTDISTWLQLHI